VCKIWPVFELLTSEITYFGRVSQLFQTQIHGMKSHRNYHSSNEVDNDSNGTDY